MTHRRFARMVLRASGLVLMLLGAVHLIATPEIPHLLDGLPPKARSFAIGPTLLNHVLVGILLLPLGFTTWLAAAERHLLESWTRLVLGVNCLVVMSLPLALVLFMRQPQYYRAPLFLAGATLTGLAAISIAIAAWVATSAPRPK